MKNDTYADTIVDVHTTYLMMIVRNAEYYWGNKDIHGRMGAIMRKAGCLVNSDPSKLNELLDYILEPLNKSITRYPEKCQAEMRNTLKRAMQHATELGWADS